MPRTIELSELERRKLSDAGRQSIPCIHGWRPIETAPKDGRHILVYSNDRIISAYWSFSAEDWAEVLYGDIMQPTHWMELPAPPDIIGEQIIREEEEAEIRRELDFEDEFPHGLEGDE